jgi:hypothetical protein
VDSIGEVSALIYFAGQAKFYAVLLTVVATGTEYARRQGLLKF